MNVSGVMTKLHHVACAAAMGLLATGLQTCSPMRPSGASEGITAYQHPRYDGDARRLAADERDLDDVVGPCGGEQRSWDDCISSIRVPEGWRAIVYEDDNYRGESLTVTSDIPDLDNVRGPCGNDWDDCISSIRVFRP